MGDNLPSSTDPSISSVNQPILKNRRVKPKTSKSIDNVDTYSSDCDDSIKYRLRKTPRKCKDAVSSGNVNILKSTYQIESASLQAFLNKQQLRDNNLREGNNSLISRLESAGAKLPL